MIGRHVYLLHKPDGDIAAFSHPDYVIGTLKSTYSAFPSISITDETLCDGSFGRPSVIRYTVESPTIYDQYDLVSTPVLDQADHL